MLLILQSISPQLDQIKRSSLQDPVKKDGLSTWNEATLRGVSKLPRTKTRVGFTHSTSSEEFFTDNTFRTMEFDMASMSLGLSCMAF